MQKTFRFIVVFLVLWANILPLSSQKVTFDLAKEKATLFFNKSNCAYSVEKKAPRKTPLLTLANNCDEYYVFNDEANGGYVVISGDERMPDVLGYSRMGRFELDDMPCNKRAWLEKYAGQVKYLRSHPNANVEKSKMGQRKEITPLLGNTAWHQTWPYNAKCPSLMENSHCPTGCVATAMAQIMYYYKWPKQTACVIPGYTTATSKIKMPEMPVTKIDWSNIIDQHPRSGCTEQQIDAVSTLMLLCGTAVEMDYGLFNSSAFTSSAAKAFAKYFDYEAEDEWIFGYLEGDSWEEMIYGELSQGRPVFYNGMPDVDPEHAEEAVGHAFIVDGYKDGYIHVNWGWGEVTDEYYFPAYVDGYIVVEALTRIKPVKPGEPREYAVLDNGKITFYNDTEKDRRSGVVLPSQMKCSGYEEKITECVIDPSFADFEYWKLDGFFSGCKNLRSIKGLEYINTSKANSLAGMFRGCASLTNINLNNFDISNVSDLSGMFEGCSSLTSLDLSSLDTKNVTNMGGMFNGCSSLTSLDLSHLDTKNVTNMGGMFKDCSSLSSINFSHFDTKNVTNMGEMFMRCSSLSSLDLRHFETSNVTNMESMFEKCLSLTGLDLSHFNTSKVTNMRSMFDSRIDGSKLTNLDISSFDTSKVTDMSNMFNGCNFLTSLNLCSFDTYNVTSMEGMFYDCKSLKVLDLSSFDTSNVTDMKFMFYNCWNVETIYVGDGWQIPDVQPTEFGYDEYFFLGCQNLVGGAGTWYNFNRGTVNYAHADGGSENPGLLTYKENTKVALPISTIQKNGDVYSLNGVRIRSAAKDLEGLKTGVYVVGGKKMVLK